MRVRVPERGLRMVDDEALWYDDDVLITRDAAWTAVEVPLVPFGFRSKDDRVALGWASTLALAGLRSGELTIKVARRPFHPEGWAARTEEFVSRVGAPAPHWPEHLAAQAERMTQTQVSEKHVFILRKLGVRSLSAQWASRGSGSVSAREVRYWAGLAATERALLARGGFDAEPVDGPTLRWLRGHALSRGLVPPRPTATGRRSWGRGEIADEFSHLTLVPLARGVRVDGGSRSVFTATLVASAFPVESWFPETPPWLAHLDRVGPWAEGDLMLSLVPPAEAKRNVVSRLRLAADQRHDAHSSGADLPIETEQVHELARSMESEIPALRRPLVYGWARFRVDADSEEELAYRVARLVERYADEDSPRIDLALPTGMAQVDLLMEGVPGQKVAHRSWKQRWTCETVGCALPQAGSNLGHSTGLYVGPTTGRYVQAVTLDPHHAITRRTARDVEGPGGMVLLGAQRSGKSGAMGRMLTDATERGYTSVCVDFSGPLARVAELARFAGRIQVLNLVKVGGGVLDPMSPAVIPGDARVDRRVREARKHLTRDTLHLLAWRSLEADPDMESELLRAITDVAVYSRPSTAEVLNRLGRSQNRSAQALAERLRFDLGQDADALIGEGELVEDTGEPVTRIITAPGLALPAAGVPISQWMPAQALGAAVFGVAAHLAWRLLWDMPAHHLKYLLVDEAHIAMGTEAGRRVIEQALRDGPKHSVVVGLATHNAVDLSDERITNAIGTKMLFRSRDDAELTRSHAMAGLEDTSRVRRQRRELRNGECILVTDEDVRDRVQWDLAWDPELAAALNTTAGVEH